MHAVFARSVFLLAGVGMLLSAISADARDFGFVLGEQQVELSQNNARNIDVNLKTTGEFEGEVDFKVEIDPAPSGMDIGLSAPRGGGSQGVLHTSDTNVYLDLVTTTRTAPGTYKITVTLTGTVDGQKVVRQQSLNLIVQAPPQFDLSLAPEHIFVKQGASAFTTVTTYLQGKFQAPIQLNILAYGAPVGLYSSFSGGGRETRELFSNAPEWIIDHDMGSEDGFVDSVATVRADPDVPPGQYEFAVEGIYNPRYVGGDHRPGEPQKKFRIPFLVTVVADERYAYLQDPPNFDLLAERDVIAVYAGAPKGELTWVGAWGDRWESTILMELDMKNKGSGISASVVGEKRLNLPTDNRAYSVDAIIVVPEGTPPGDYPAVITGTTKAPNGKTRTKTAEIIVRVLARENSQPQVSVGQPPLSSAGAIRPGDPYAENFQWPGQREAAANAAACELLSEAADTIACSVQTFKKPDLSGESANDAEVGESVERPDGTFDTEVFIRNPADNNLRTGCAGLDEAILNSLTNANWPFGSTPPETRYEHIACNAAAQSRQQQTLPDSVLADGRKQQCDSKPKVVNKALSEVTPDPKGMIEDTEKFTVGAIEMTLGKDGAEKLEGLSKAFEATDSGLAKLGLEFADLKKTNEAIKGSLAASAIVADGVTGNEIKADKVKAVMDSLKGVTGIEQIGTVSSAFDVAVALKTLKLKIQGKGKVTYDDLSGLVDKIDTLRGDKFKALGEVLGGVKKNIKDIKNAEEMVGKLSKVVDFVNKQGEPQTDPMELYDGFTEYVEVLGGVAEKVPGMGQFVEVYTDALKNMRDNVKNLVDAKNRSEAAVASWDDVFKSTQEIIDEAEHKAFLEESRAEALGENIITEDWQTFRDGWDPPVGEVRISKAQEIYNNATYEPRKAVAEAKERWKKDQECIIDQSARMEALKKERERILKEINALPPQAELDKAYDDLIQREVYYDQHKGDISGLTAENAARMGFSSLKEAKAAVATWASRGSELVIKARRFAEERKGAFKNLAARYNELAQELSEAEKRRNDCADRLAQDEIEYLQALRDYTQIHAHHYFNVVNKDMANAKANHDKIVADSLAAIDTLISIQGYGVKNGKVVITVIDDCNTKTRTTRVSTGQ